MRQLRPHEPTSIRRWWQKARQTPQPQQSHDRTGSGGSPPDTHTHTHTHIAHISGQFRCEVHSPHSHHPHHRPPPIHHPTPGHRTHIGHALVLHNSLGGCQYPQLLQQGRALRQAQHQVECGLLLDVVVRQRAAVLQLLAREDQAPVFGRDGPLVLDLRLDVLDRVGALHLQGDRYGKRITITITGWVSPYSSNPHYPEQSQNNANFSSNPREKAAIRGEQRGARYLSGGF